MYRVNGACTDYGSCLYVPATDTLVTKQYLINGYVRSLVIYKNFSQRLTKVINGISIEYNFDSSNPDYIFQSSTGYAWPVGAVAVSDNGQWLAVEFRNLGVGLLNLETFEMKRVTTTAYRYGYGSDPAIEMSVDNRGNHIAVMGYNSGFAVYDVDAGCGDTPNDDRMASYNIPITSPCKEANIVLTDFVDRFYAAIYPKFNESGGELNFYAISYNGDSYEVTIRASGYSPQRIDLLALGDSYISGEGETDDNYYLPNTNTEYEKCHVSSRAYPFLLANLQGIDPNFVRSVACSGATTEDVVGAELNYNGQDERLVEKLGNNSTEITLEKTDAKYLLIPGRVHQERFVERYNPGVIILGIGGNDAGLMKKLASCAGPVTCDWVTDAKNREQTANEIKGLFGTLVKTYQKLHDDSPNSKIYVVGYPKVVDSVNECSPFINLLLDKTEREFANESIIYVNQVIAAAAQSAGVSYIDIQDSYGNNVICGSAQSAVNTVRFGGEVSLIGGLDLFRFIGSESFHPNPLGQSLTANSINNSVGSLIYGNYCGINLTICPDSLITTPEPSAYWLPSGSHNYPTQHAVDFVSDSVDPNDIKQKKITVDGDSFLPGSTVEVDIHSDPISLGSFTASSNGSLDINISLPDQLEEGYHTIRLYGTSYSGEAIELYQIIKYEKPVVVVTDEPEIPKDTTSVATSDVTAIQPTTPETPTENKETKTEVIDNENEIAVVGANDVLNNPFVKYDSIADNKLADSDQSGRIYTNWWTIYLMAIFTMIALVVIARIRKNNK